MSSTPHYHTKNATEIDSITTLLPEFRECHSYDQRLTFWDRHWDDLKESGCVCGSTGNECNCDVELCYAAIDFDDEQDAGKARVNFGLKLWIICKTWEDVLNWPILTLAPFSKREARQFVDWALQKRPAMSGAPESAEKLRAQFDQEYTAIPSNLDRSEFLEAARLNAYRWKNNEIGGKHANRKDLGSFLGIDMDLFSEFARMNKVSKPIDLARYIPLNRANMNWKVIDTYLFAQSKYQYALYLEHFIPVPAKGIAQDLVLRQPELLKKSIFTEALTANEIGEVVDNIIAPLNGLGPNKKRIMAKGDFALLTEYTKYLATTDQLPDIRKPFPQINISADHIRYTFYRLHEELFGTRRIHKSFIEFLHAAFSQFANTQPTSTRKKFSTKPKSYDMDFKLDAD
jgi:hypothetical protein